MRPILSKPILGLLLMILLGIFTQAQEKNSQVKVKISREIDGEQKTFEKTYESEEAMEADEDLKKFMESEGGTNFFFSDKAKSFEWNDENSGGQSFFFNFGDDDATAHNFHFFQDGDSTMKEFDFQMGMLDEHFKDLDIKIKEHMKAFENGEPFAYSLGDDSNFMFHFDDSLSDEISIKMQKMLDGVDDFEVIVLKKNINISDDVADFGKKAEVKPSDKLTLEDLTYYPNPAPNGRFKLKFKVEKASELEIKIYNLDSKTIFNRYFEKFGGQFSETIDLAQQKEGIYLLEITMDGKRLTRKIAID